MQTKQQELSKEMSLKAAESFYAVEKYGFGSPEHKEARGYFYEAKDQYEEYCRNAGIPAYAFYSED